MSLLLRRIEGALNSIKRTKQPSIHWLQQIPQIRLIDHQAIGQVQYEQIADEFGLLLTISTLMLGVVLSMMFAVNRDEISAAVQEDIKFCKNTANKGCVKSYDFYIFFAGSLCAEGCATVMIVSMLMSWSLNLLRVRSRSTGAAALFYHQHALIIRGCYPVLVVCFILAAYASINVMFIKIRNAPLQAAVYDASLIWWGIMFLLVIWLARKHLLMKRRMFSEVTATVPVPTTDTAAEEYE